MTERIVYRPKLGSDGLFTEPEPRETNAAKAKREMNGEKVVNEYEGNKPVK